MAEPFIGEVRLMSFNFAPKGWAQCFGQFMPINQNQALFSLLGNMYGGNGQTTFALPNFSGRVPIHRGLGFIQGQAGGEPAHTLTISETPAHVHAVNADGTQPSTNQPSSNAYLANSSPPNLWGPVANPQAMAVAMIGNSGGSQPHENRMPFLAVTFCIALQGIFPSRN
jgi:microcystin-dependent protein